MQKQLDEELSKAFARCVSLQLLNIELPDQYEGSIVDTQVNNNKRNNLYIKKKLINYS